jgi:membrane protein required for beta-lactamase induction
MTELTIHHCTGLRLVRTFVSNGNSVTLGIIDSRGGVTEIVLYNLPAEVTEKLDALRDADTQDFHDAEHPVARELQAAGIVERVDLPELPDGVEAYAFKNYSDAAQGE